MEVGRTAKRELQLSRREVAKEWIALSKLNKSVDDLMWSLKDRTIENNRFLEFVMIDRPRNRVGKVVKNLGFCSRSNPPCFWGGFDGYCAT